MANEPEKHEMDELLKAYAQKRKAEAGDPLALHPATRKLLQDEVTLVYGKTPSAGEMGWGRRLLVFWPRVGFAAATLLVLAIVIVAVLPTRKETRELARRAPAASPSISNREELDRALNESLTLAYREEKENLQEKKEDGLMREGKRIDMAGGVMLDKKKTLSELTASGDIAQVTRDRPAPAFDLGVNAPAATAPEAFELKQKDVLAKNAERMKTADTSGLPHLTLRSGAGATNNPELGRVVSPSPAESSLSLAQKADMDADATRHRYFYSGVASTNSIPPARYVQMPAQQGAVAGIVINEAQQILTSFDFEKNGDQVRIVDADGSVYQGQVLPSSDDYFLGAKLERESRQTEVGKPIDGVQRRVQPQAQQLFFRVSGTNRSLRKLVTVEANFSPPEVQQQSSAPGRNAPIAPTTRQAAPASQADSRHQTRTYGVIPQQVTPSIWGRARIGTNQEVPIEAIPAQR